MAVKGPTAAEVAGRLGCTYLSKILNIDQQRKAHFAIKIIHPPPPNDARAVAGPLLPRPFQQTTTG